MASSDDPFSTLLRRAQAGDRDARDRLVAALYDEFRALARRRLRRERPGHTLQTTALVNEALARLLADATLERATDRTFLLRAASRAMERVLVDHHRRRAAAKGPGRRARQPLDDILDRLEDAAQLPLLELQEALLELEGVDFRAALVVRLHVFLELSQPEVGETLGIGVKTVERDWRFARGWLRARLGPGADR